MLYLAAMSKKDLKHFLLKGQDTFLKHLSVDCVIFGFHDDQLKVLLVKWVEGWSIPGGFVRKDESINEAAKRVLKERTGLDRIFLKQFEAFGETGREKGKKGFDIPGTWKSWYMERFVTIGYWALVEFSKVTPRRDWLSEDCRWWDINEVPKLIFDHNRIVTAALEALRHNLIDHPVGYNLLPEKFTMPELQSLYETILGIKLDRRNFQKKMLAMDVLVRTNERRMGVSHKPPYYYRFDKKKYERAMKNGLMRSF